MTAIWIGLTTVNNQKDRIDLVRSDEFASSMKSWLGLRSFAIEIK